MGADKTHNVYGEVKETGITKTIEGIQCDVVKMHFPVDNIDGEWRWVNAYRFTAPGWDECTIVGLAAAKRVIRGRTDTAVLNTMGINPYAATMYAQKQDLTKAYKEKAPTSVINTIREYRDMQSQSIARTERNGKTKQPEQDR